MQSVEGTTAELEKEFSTQDSKMKELPLEGDSNVLETSMQSSSYVTEQLGEIIPPGTATGSDGRPLLTQKELFPLMTVTKRMRTLKSFYRDFLATRRKGFKTRPYSSKISGS